MKKVRKLTDEQFFAILRENGGIYARTARAIEARHGIPYTRQAVRDRAESNPSILRDIEEQNIDVAEDSVRSLMQSENESIRLRSSEFYLRTKGRRRGYFEKTEQEITVQGSQYVSPREFALRFMLRVLAENLTLSDAIIALEITELEGVSMEDRTYVAECLKRAELPNVG